MDLAAPVEPKKILAIATDLQPHFLERKEPVEHVGLPVVFGVQLHTVQAAENFLHIYCINKVCLPRDDSLLTAFHRCLVLLKVCPVCVMKSFPRCPLPCWYFPSVVELNMSDKDFE